MQANNQIQAVHIKVSHNDETRRFRLEEVTYDKLVSVLKTLFSINPASVLALKYQDDEQDWVVLGSDEELKYASDLSSTIKVLFQVNAVSPAYGIPVEKETEIQVETKESEETCGPEPGVCSWKGRGKWGRCNRGRKGPCEGRGRGRGKGFGGFENRISGRIEHLQAKIDSGEVPQQKVEMLKARLEKLRSQVDNTSSQEDTVKPEWNKSVSLANKISVIEEKIAGGDLPEGRLSALRNRLEHMKAKHQALSTGEPVKKWGCKNPERIQHRIAMIKAKIESGTVPAERAAILENRLAKLQEKLETLESL